ncbi:MAG: tRNA (N6-isopentenyl adenosine(37)-C2)-methylthiotransferase MiaB [Spirochaetaceae bacterium]|nr:tRNA (N6-isopentenyl adenosine(37)-C2)-methylthiotransferase MiaB [Myxococcales bacterium]MCB9725396.1 tRNA (N6-isopentenyl adenosine(37)-C2)-methylthiotransferase MiaB [Spirochaetaceae bacterium]
MDRRRFAIRTYGCQMNVHDSEKLSAVLDGAGLSPTPDESQADLLVINTCSIRDKAEHQLYSDLGKLRQWKAERPGRLVGVGGCVAQQVGDRLLGRFPQVDFVFGTHNLRRVPALLRDAAAGRRAAWIDEDATRGRFDLPLARVEPAGGPRRRAFVTVMEGCDMFCSFCIVPSTRGREISRTARDIEAEVRALADAGVVEITLLGQTVNAYGRHDVRRGRAEDAGTMPFAELLARLDAIPGLERIRYTSPHPLFFDEALIRAHGELERLCPQVHLPVQSGSDRILEAMRRRYDRRRYLGIVEALRTARPDVAITSDLIVGFPGETEEDFEQTLDLVREAGLVDSFSFKYSARPGTAAAGLGGEVPPEVAQDRLERLQSQQREQTLAYHASRVGERARVLLDGASRRGGGQVMGRDRHNRVVNVDLTPGTTAGPGDALDVVIVGATPHSLLGRPLAAGNSPDPR